jgi:ABC-type multidrug transport system fused ATPase/permease subunit
MRQFYVMNLTYFIKHIPKNLRIYFYLNPLLGLAAFGFEAVMLNLFNIVFSKLNFLNYEPTWSKFFSVFTNGQLFLILFVLIVSKQLMIVVGAYTMSFLKNKLEHDYRTRINQLQTQKEEEYVNQLVTAYSYHSEKASDIVIFFSLAMTSLFQLIGFVFYAIYISPKNFLVISIVCALLVIPLVLIERKTKLLNFED